MNVKVALRARQLSPGAATKDLGVGMADKNIPNFGRKRRQVSQPKMAHTKLEDGGVSMRDENGRRFLKQIAIQYVTGGHWFYVSGTIPETKNPLVIDRKLLELYEIDLSKSERSRRRAAGVASVHYLRHGRFWVLMASEGRHRFWDSVLGESRLDDGGRETRIRDFRRASSLHEPLKYRGYSVSYVNGHVSVSLEEERRAWLREHYVSMATKCSAEKLGAEFEKELFEPYAPVRGQVRAIWRAVNRSREAAGMDEVPSSALRFRWGGTRVFE